MRVAHTEPKRCPLRASNSSVVGAYHASEHVLITQLDSETYVALWSLMQWHRLKLSWYPTRTNGAQVLQRCHNSLLQRKVSGPLQTRNRQLLEDNQRVKREDRRRAARVPIGLRHRASDLYNSGTPRRGPRNGAGGHHEEQYKVKEPASAHNSVTRCVRRARSRTAACN